MNDRNLAVKFFQEGASKILVREGCQRAVYPPSTTRLCPVTKEARPEQSHKTASATSSTRPIRPMGCKVARSSLLELNGFAEPVDHLRVNHRGVDRVNANPLRGIISKAAVFVRPITARLEARRSQIPGTQVYPATDETVHNRATAALQYLRVILGTSSRARRL